MGQAAIRPQCQRRQAQFCRVLEFQAGGRPGRLVLMSQDLPATTVRDTELEGVDHHEIGTPRDSDSDDTVSVGRGSEQDIRSVASSPGEAVVDVDPLEVDDGFADAASAVSEDVEASAPVEPDPPVREVAITPAVRAAFAWLDQVDLVEVFKPRASVMKSVPRFLCGAFRIALRTALQEAVLGGDVGDEVRQTLLLLPRMLPLESLTLEGTIGKDKLVKRFHLFAEGQWAELVRFSVQCAAELANVRRRDTDSEAKRGERAFMFAQLGELSSARQALEGGEVAVGNQEIVEAFETATCPVPRSVARQHRAPHPSFRIRVG